MKQEAIDAITHSPQVVQGAKFTGGSGVLTGFLGYWAWIGENADQLTAVFGAIGAMCAVGGLIYTVWQGERAYRKKRDKE